MYSFYTTCEDSYSVGDHGEDINEMTATPNMIEIDNSDFINKIAKNGGFKEAVLDVFPHLSEDQFIEDFALSCHKSHFQGQDCYYVRFSAIEHIFVNNELMSNLLRGEEAQERRDVIEALENSLDEYEQWNNSKTKKEEYDALLSFTKDNLSTFESNNIHLGSLFAYGHNHGKIVSMIDNELFLSKTDDNELSI